jgi:molecular chaperone GrpE
MEGIKLIYKKMTNVLEKEGLKVIPAKGEKFDPYKHEALMATKSDDYENGEIIDELMKGYTLKDKVIKYSKVNVCKK